MDWKALLVRTVSDRPSVLAVLDSDLLPGIPQCSSVQEQILALRVLFNLTAVPDDATSLHILIFICEHLPLSFFIPQCLDICLGIIYNCIVKSSVLETQVVSYLQHDTGHLSRMLDMTCRMDFESEWLLFLLKRFVTRSDLFRVVETISLENLFLSALLDAVLEEQPCISVDVLLALLNRVVHLKSEMHSVSDLIKQICEVLHLGLRAEDLNRFPEICRGITEILEMFDDSMSNSRIAALDPDEARQHPLYGLRNACLKLICQMLALDPALACTLADSNLVEGLTSCLRLDPWNPLLREWSTVALRVLLPEVKDEGRLQALKNALSQSEQSQVNMKLDTFSGEVELNKRSV